MRCGSHAPAGAHAASFSKRSGCRAPRRSVRFPPRLPPATFALSIFEMIEERERGVLEQAERVVARGFVGVAVAGQVADDHAAVLRAQRGDELFVLFDARREPVEKEQRRLVGLLADVDVAQAHPIEHRRVLLRDGVSPKPS